MWLDYDKQMSEDTNAFTLTKTKILEKGPRDLWSCSQENTEYKMGVQRAADTTYLPEVILEASQK